MTTPNLDATWHCWVESLARFTFSTQYQKGKDNAATDALRCVTSKLDAVTVKSFLDGFTMGMTKELLLITWWWLMLIRRYINKSRKLQFWLGPPMCM